MNPEYAIKLMKQENTTICPECIETRNDNCKNMVVCNKDLNNFLGHNYEKENTILLKCNDAYEIQNAISNKKDLFKINNYEFKIIDGKLFKKDNNNWNNLW